MNALTKTQSNTDVVEVLQNSLYPGAKRESIELALAWCRATGRDPMKKPIHIVPMWVKNDKGGGSYMDVLMPGIGTYRTDAARTGEYAGKTEPEFGPSVTSDIDGMKVAHPEWCRVTVYRLIAGAPRPFTAMEFWLENYASGKGGKGVNDMWKKRAFGQLAKCAESQALRMAFPEETGNTNTIEEMEGKGDIIDALPQRIQLTAAKPQTVNTSDTAQAIGDSIPALDEPPKRTLRDGLRDSLLACQSRDDVRAVAEKRAVKAALDKGTEEQRTHIMEMLTDAYARFPQEATPEPEGADDGWPGPETEAAHVG